MKNNYPLKKQICTLEQAKKLAKFLGKDAPGSLWGWAASGYGKNVKYFLVLGPHVQDTQSEYYHAYNGDELLELLPEIITKKDKNEICKTGTLLINKYTSNGQTGHAVRYINICNNKNNIAIKTNKNGAHAKADLAIEGFEDGYIKIENFKYEK